MSTRVMLYGIARDRSCLQVIYLNDRCKTCRCQVPRPRNIFREESASALVSDKRTFKGGNVITDITFTHLTSKFELARKQLEPSRRRRRRW